MSSQITQRNHHRAVRFFWGLLVAATIVSLTGNVVHAVLPHIPRVVVQVGAATVPPVVLLASVHGIAVAVRAGASGAVYRWAVGAVAVIGGGAFTISFLALRDLMLVIGYRADTAWIFPAIIDTAVAVSTMMLVALGDKPARRLRATKPSVGSAVRITTLGVGDAAHDVKPKARHVAPSGESRLTQAMSARFSVPDRRGDGGDLHASVQCPTGPEDARLAGDLIASGATTQSAETVIAVLDAWRRRASINAAAKASAINYRTAQRIVKAAGEAAPQLTAVG